MAKGIVSTDNHGKRNSEYRRFSSWLIIRWASTDPINDGLGVRGDGDECVGVVGLPEHLQHRARLNQSINHTVNKSIN
jgi:hypothetical protein